LNWGYSYLPFCHHTLQFLHYFSQVKRNATEKAKRREAAKGGTGEKLETEKIVKLYSLNG